MKLRDRIWIWGHPAGAHNGLWNVGDSRMTVTEACAYLGVSRALMVCFGNAPKPPFDREAKAMDGLEQVIWSVVGDASCDNSGETLGHLEEILRLAKVHKNIRGMIFDDFFSPQRMAVYTPPVIAAIRQRLRAEGPMELWTVIYTHELKEENRPYFDAFNAFTFWTWRQEELELFEENLAQIRAFIPDKKLLLGCYLYDFGNSCPMSVEHMEYQLNRYAQALRSGEADGIILLSNTVADLDYPAVEYARRWIADHGDETI